MSAPAGGGVRPTDASVRAVLATPGAPAMALWSVVARFGLGMLNLSVLFFVSSETGSYSVAGALSAASLVGAAAGTVAQGRWIDRFGPTRPLLALVVPHALLGAAVVAAVAASVPTVVVAAVIVAQSAALPAVAVASRAMWPHLVPAGRAREAAYSYEAVSFELCWLLGPVAASLLATVFWPGTALVVALTLATVGAVGFSLTGVVRSRRGATAARSNAAPPGRVGDRESTGQPRSNGLATLLAAASGFGLGIGFVVVGVTAGTAASAAWWSNTAGIGRAS